MRARRQLEIRIDTCKQAVVEYHLTPKPETSGRFVTYSLYKILQKSIEERNHNNHSDISRNQIIVSFVFIQRLPTHAYCAC